MLLSMPACRLQPLSVQESIATPHTLCFSLFSFFSFPGSALPFVFFFCIPFPLLSLSLSLSHQGSALPSLYLF